MNIQFELQDGSKCQGEVVRRSGKATGKYGKFWYIKDTSDNVTKEYDTENDWKHWNNVVTLEKNTGAEDIYVIEQSVQENKTEIINQAKKAEIAKWIEENVMEEVKDTAQERLSTTWVITTKLKNDQEVTKARLVVRGYEEETKSRSDSPTCMKDNVRMLLAIAVGKGWNLDVLDVKAAFLQGKSIERELYITPPKEFRKEGVLWKLKKVVYGLTDASRSWYLKISQVLEDLGMKVCELDKAVFRYGNGSLEGIIMVHVDDLLYSGTKEFYEQVISPFQNTFKVSRQDSKAFKYIGINIHHSVNSITLDQKDYLDSIKVDLLPIESMKDKTRIASDDEKRVFKQGIGQLGWLTSISKPEGAYAYCVLSTLQSKPKISDFIRLRKAVRDLKTSETWIKIGKLNLENLKISAYSDASFASLDQGASQLGYIIFVQDDSGKCVPVTWASKKIRRVARSSLTAETLAAVETIDSAIVVKRFVEEILFTNLPPITLFVDNKSLYDSAQTTNVISDKRLLIDMSALRQMIEDNELILKWVKSEDQLADVLTKLGANKQKLTDVLSSGCLSLDM